MAPAPDLDVPDLDMPDRHFPALHRVHPRGWINDPNGILHAEGRWHVFFQYNPHSARHELIRWGHMSSPDLVSWREEPLGPQPRPGEADQDGCWSGIGLVDHADDPAGVPTLIYSGVDGARNDLARVLLARMNAGATSLVGAPRVVADIPPVPGLIGVRDPFVLRIDGRRWAIQGAGVREGGRCVPMILLYSCDELDRWEYVGPLLRGDDPVSERCAPADLWECPQLVQVEGQWVLMLSLWRHPDSGIAATPEVTCLVGEIVTGEEGRPSFVPAAGGTVDPGPDFYAPQAVVDGERVLLWGWSWEGAGRTPEQADAQGWAGTLTFPRVLRCVDGLLLAAPAPELRALRGERLVAVEPEVGPDAGATYLLPAPARAELQVAGPVRLDHIASDGTTREILQHTGGAAAVYLDGSLLELIPEESPPCTLRFFPEPGERVRVRGAVSAAWSLAVDTAGVSPTGPDSGPVPAPVTATDR